MGIIVFALLALLTPLIAFAQGTSTVADAPSSSVTQIGLTLWEMAAPIVLGLLGWIAKKVADLINARVKNATIAGVLTRLDWAVINAVKSVQQSVVNGIKAAREESSPGGSVITAGEADGIKNEAIKQAKSFIGPKGIAELLKAFGIGEGGLDKLLGDRVEAAVHDLRQDEAAVAAGAPESASSP